VHRVLFAPRALPPLPPDVSQDRGAYSAWVSRREQVRRRARPARASGPRLGLVLLADDAPLDAFRCTLTGLQEQTSKAWAMTVVAPTVRLAELATVLRRAPRHVRRRLRIVGAAEGTPAAQRLAQALAAGDDGPVALIAAGDRWSPDAVALLRTVATPMGVVYGDEDRITPDGYEAPRLKPDYSPDFLLCTGYVGRPVAVGAALAREVIAAISSDAEAIEEEFTLRACERAQSVLHLAEVLCHRSGAGPAASAGVPRHVEDAARRVHAEATVVPAAASGIVRVRWPVPQGTTVSVLIPFRDEPRFLRTCVESVVATGGPQEMELVLIDNGSSDPETATLLERLARRPHIRVLRDTRPFNWAQLNNAGAGVARGDVLLFLNNDIEADGTGWLTALCGHALRDDVGAVGARLLYPDRRLQHCGLVVGMTGAAGHPLAGLAPEAPGYLHMAMSTRECAAVTGACLATRRTVFDRLGGFDESLGVDLNDVDYCLRAAAAGYRTLYEPAAELIHHESPSRGTAGGIGDIVHFVERWRGYITKQDPYLNPHLTRADPSCGLAGPEEEEAWNQWYSILDNQ
jgi:O-antigen biosynthesis protein